MAYIVTCIFFAGDKIFQVAIIIDESYGKYCNASRNVTKLKNMIAVVEKEMDRLHNQDYQLGQYKM